MTDPVRRAGWLHIGELVAATAARHGQTVALDDGQHALSYADLQERVDRLARALLQWGIVRGGRIAVLAENSTEYIELVLACSWTGAVACALNWRSTAAEIEHCLRLTEPGLLVVSPRFAPLLGEIATAGIEVLVLGDDYEDLLEAQQTLSLPTAVQPEDGFIILFTSGTTGAAKAASISHRAEVARCLSSRLDGGLGAGDAFVAWAPLFHMVALEHALHVLSLGGTVHIVEGADIERIVWLAERVPQWWLVLLPGMVDRVVELMAHNGRRPAPIKVVGALADLVPPALVAETSQRFAAPYWNTFGSTETGMLPFAGTRFAIGEAPAHLGKAANSLHRFKLVDAEDREVPDGQPGEVAVRGPTVFSGYWRAEETNVEDFRGGWFHMGDVFRAREDGLYDYVDRVKYLIKTGAENVYPAEIERVLMTAPQVLEAVVVRRADVRWGEVPVAFVCCTAPAPAAESLLAFCAERLARYKRPKEIRFVASLDDFPRSTSGKIQRQALERHLLQA